MIKINEVVYKRVELNILGEIKYILSNSFEIISHSENYFLLFLLNVLLILEDIYLGVFGQKT